MICLSIFLFSGCSNNKAEITISQVESKSYTIYDRMTSSPIIIDFDDFDNFTQEQYPSRSYCYTKFVLRFQNTPEGYDAYDVYKVKSVNISKKEIWSSHITEYDDYYLKTRKKENDKKSIELLLQTPYFCLKSEYRIKSVTYSYFDSVLGETAEKTIDVDYKFAPKFVDNFLNINTDSYYHYNITQHFNAVKTSNCSKTLYEFTVDTDLDYDSIIYNVDRIGTRYSSGQTEVIETESVMTKKDLYQYEANNTGSEWRIQFSIVGFIKNNVKSYFYPNRIIVYS